MPVCAAIAISSVASAGVGIAGAAGAFAPDAPQQPNYGAMTRDAQQAQIDLLPSKFNAKQTYDPQFAALQRQIQWENVYGTQSGTKTEDYIDYEAQTQRVPTGERKFNIATGTVEPVYTESTVYNPVVKTRTVQTNGTPGQLELMQKLAPQLDAMANESAARNTAAEIARVKQLGPEAFAAIHAYDPKASALSDTLLSQAQNELDAGSSLTASESRQYEQAVRGAQASRGLGMGPTDAYQEAVTMGTAGTNRLRDRQSLASSVLGQRNAIYGNPYQAILNRSAGQTANPSPYLASSQSTVPDYTAINPAAYQVGLAGYNAQNQADIAGYNGQMSSMGGLMSGMGSIARAYSGSSRGGYSAAPNGTYSTPYASYAPGANAFAGTGYGGY